MNRVVYNDSDARICTKVCSIYAHVAPAGKSHLARCVNETRKTKSLLFMLVLHLCEVPKGLLENESRSNDRDVHLAHM